MHNSAWSDRRKGALVVASVTLLALTSVAVVRSRQEPTQRPERVSIGESTARKRVTNSVLPHYPEESLKRGAQGVAVVEVVFDVVGHVVDVRALQAPDAACREASVRAVRDWTFKPLPGPNGRPARVTTKLTFYFGIDPAGRGTVTNAEVLDGIPSSDSGGRFGGSIDADGLKRLAAEGGLRIVDIRPREMESTNRLPGAMLLPFDELASRARELAGTKSVVVTCYEGFENVCDIAARQIAQFTDARHVYVLTSSPKR